MDISNRILVISLLVMVVLVGGAIWLTVDPRPKTEVPQQQKVRVTRPNAPVPPEVHRTGAQDVRPEGPLQVALPKEVTAKSVKLICDMFKSERRFNDGKVLFPDIPPNRCRVMLMTRPSEKDVATTYGPVFPGDQLTCWLDEGGGTTCSGGLAQERSGSVSVRAEAPGRLLIDGNELGPLPIADHPLRVGEHRLELQWDAGGQAVWTLEVQPDEILDVLFPAPATIAPVVPAVAGGDRALQGGTRLAPATGTAGSP